MSTVVSFGNKNIVEPGVYAQIQSGINVKPEAFSTGNVMIIDTGEGAALNYGGGAGINGQLVNKKKAIYGFDSLIDFRRFVRAGLLWDIADYLFNPINGAPGVQKLFLVRAATTVCASVTYTFVGGGANGGVFKFNTKNEGVGSNGVSSTSKVRVGYGALMKAGTVNTSAFVIEFYEGTYKGTDADGDPYDGISQATAEPIIVTRSTEFTNIADLINWAKTDSGFYARFDLDATTVVTGSGLVDAADLSANNTLKLAAGGTTVYNSGDLDTVLDNIGEVDNTFFLSLKTEANAQGTENVKLLSHITNDAEFKKFIWIGGGNDSTKFALGAGNSSIDTAVFFNTAYVTVVHSGAKIKVPFNVNDKMKRVVYHAAAALGRVCGLQPQTPGTFKGLRFTNFVHELNQGERVSALQSGVLHNRFVPNIGYVINQTINSLQKNTQLINPDGKSHAIEIMRIAEQLNKELVLNMRPLFVGQNLNTGSPADVKAFIEGYLTFKVATKTQDNLILRFEKVAVKQTQDYYEVTYGFVPNGPLNKIFITGFILDANLSA